MFKILLSIFSLFILTNIFSQSTTITHKELDDKISLAIQNKNFEKAAKLKDIKSEVTLLNKAISLGDYAKAGTLKKKIALSLESTYATKKNNIQTEKGEKLTLQDIEDKLKTAVEKKDFELAIILKKDKDLLIRIKKLSEQGDYSAAAFLEQQVVTSLYENQKVNEMNPNSGFSISFENSQNPSTEVSSVEYHNPTIQNNQKNIEKNTAIDKVSNDMNLRSDEREIIEIISMSTNSRDAWYKLQQKNITNLNSYTLGAINRLTNEIPNFPLTSYEVQSLTNGSNFNDIIRDINYQNSNLIAQELGLDANQTQAMNIIATSSSSEEMLNRLQEHNINQISQYTADGLQSLLGDSYGSLPITSGDINNMLNGNFETALQNIQYNQNLNNISNTTYNEAQLTNAAIEGAAVAATLIADAIEETQYQNAKNFVNYTNSLIKINDFKNSNGSFQTEAPYKYIANFNDSHWHMEENNFVALKIQNDNEISINFTSRYDEGELKRSDQNFLSFESDQLEIGKDFIISFKIGHNKRLRYQREYQHLLLSKTTDKKELREIMSDLNRSNGIGFFMSQTNKLSINNKEDYLTNSFTPNFNPFQNSSNKLIKLNEISPKLFQIAYTDQNKIKSDAMKESDRIRAIASAEEEKLLAPMSPRQRLNYYKDKSKKATNEYNELITEKNYNSNMTRQIDAAKMKIELTPPNDIYYVEYRIVKKGLFLYVESIEEYENKKLPVKRSEPFEFKYINENKLYFGLDLSIFSLSSNQNHYYACKPGETITLKDFSIQQ